MNSAFRTLGPALERRLESATTPFAVDEGSRVLARRITRTVCGAVGAAGGAIMFAAATGLLVAKPFFSDAQGALTIALLATLAASSLAGLAVRPWAARRARALAEPPALTGNAAHDLAALEIHARGGNLQRAVSRIELASVALPLVAWALLAPLSLHFLVGEGFSVLGGSPLPLSDFDKWIAASTVLVGVPHLVLALCAFLFARKVRRLDVEGVRALGHAEGFKALGATTLVSLFPGILLIGVPTVLVLVTGLVFVPLSFRWMRNRVVEERMTMEAFA